MAAVRARAQRGGVDEAVGQPEGHEDVEDGVAREDFEDIDLVA